MNVKDVAHGYSDYVIQMRRILHEHPEVSTKEYETSRIIREELDKMGIPYVMCGLETGVLASIKGAKPGKTILLRADMDALSVSEENDLSFKSKNPGVMHACGHDGHAAALLTVARILNDMRDVLSGTVKLAFQPAEEVGLGAESMVAQGAMDGVDAAFAIHLWSAIPSGYANVQEGPRMSSASEFIINIQGKGGHGAEPHKCIDTIPCAAAIVNSLQTLVSREFNPRDTVVCTVGKLSAGTAWNVIAESAEIRGTTRCYDKRIFDELPERIRRIAEGISEAYRCSITFEYENHAKPTINDPVMSKLCRNSAFEIFGDKGDYAFPPNTIAEDFPLFIEAAPNSMGALALVGIGSEEADSCHPHHSPKFKIDESALLNSVCLYCQVALDFLSD